MSPEQHARRLLASSADKFYDPEVDIDRAAPWVDGLPFVPDHRVTLYGTELWENLTPRQRLELGKHEAVSMVSYGIYAEAALMHILLRLVTEGDPATSRTQYTLTEIGDECRHSTMFARFIEKSGIPAYRQPDGRKAALANPHYRRTMVFMAEKLVAFLDESGMLKGRLVKALWRRSQLLPRERGS
jgi:hypothetical protein